MEKYKKLRREIWKYYRGHKRDLPWRRTSDPYKIMVSEIMLQQTQVARVIPKYKAFLKKFPNVALLAKATPKDVLVFWQGLGYNRRALNLHKVAQILVEKYKGKVPLSADELQKLPGIGPYTARAVAAFAHNADVVFIETNLRTVVTHHFFPRKKVVSDKELLAILEKAFPKGKSREWYAALMDYGAHLKRSGVRLNAKAKGYKKQKVFRGSSREARGAILKALVRGPRDAEFLTHILGDDRVVQAKSQLASLTKEGLIELSNGKFRLPQ